MEHKASFPFFPNLLGNKYTQLYIFLCIIPYSSTEGLDQFTVPPIVYQCHYFSLQTFLILPFCHFSPKSCPHHPMCSRSCFSSVFPLLWFFLCMWIVFFLIGPAELSWISALMLAEESMACDLTTVDPLLCTMFFYFCSFHSASIPGGHSSSPGIPPVPQSSGHNSIPSPADATTCSVIPQWKGVPSFSSFLPLQRAQLKIFLHKSFSLRSLWGTNPALNGMAGSKGRQFFSALCAHFQIASRNGWISSQLYQQCLHVPIVPQPVQVQHSLFSPAVI